MQICRINENSAPVRIAFVFNSISFEINVIVIVLVLIVVVNVIGTYSLKSIEN